MKINDLLKAASKLFLEEEIRKYDIEVNKIERNVATALKDIEMQINQSNEVNFLIKKAVDDLGERFNKFLN